MIRRWTDGLRDRQTLGLWAAIFSLLWSNLLLAPAAASAQQPAPASMSLSLDDALRLALPASEAVGIARAAVARARGEEKKARSEFFPQLTGSASYTRTLKSQFSRASSSKSDSTSSQTCNTFTADPTQPIGVRVDSLESALGCLSNQNPFAAFSSLPFGQKNQYNLGLQASWLLFAGGRVRAQSAAAEANKHSAEVGLTAQETQLTLDVTQAYYDAALADRLLEIAQATLELADSTYQQTLLAKQVGAQAEFDLLKAQVSRDNQRPVVIQREADRDISYLKLRQLLNLPLEQTLTLSTVVDDSLLAAVPLLDSLQATNGDTAPEARVAVRQAEFALRAQEAQFNVARAERWPTITLSSNFARLGYPSDLLPSWNDFVSDWNVGLALKVPLFTGGRITGSVMSARAQLDDARLRLSQTREKVAVDNRTVLARRRQAEAQWLASQGTVGQAARAYAIAEIRYREGISTQTELTEARVQLEQARANRATAARDVQIARVRVALLANLPL